MFDIGAQIQRLACACLTIVHDIFDSVLYPDSDSTPTSEEDLHDATYSFSWVKEYRVYRALWYMCYHSDLHGALNQWHWPSESIYRLSEPAIMLHVMESSIVYQIWRAELWLECLGLRCVPAPRWFRSWGGPLTLFPNIKSFSCAEYPAWPFLALPAESDGSDIRGRTFHPSQAGFES
ncbi:hypothetical protein ASPVEDRAFT_237297 [Aspergillus versicolor CBS 583.65]|uniref:Uncharacterized protein n=1 Tax=Aspergillus versicolor CBS 583.65 TaxID=1036611 RepID=A0A1L9P4G9_ASPVE|nr:uncharacterized protein ASPVEDRAFT_237297 [Aspergillus versicolor CBS 583.65]OJI96415.1 hypothetical protein ASPVEDRAFT_237297 [Aspergillus versicolor CBS 583.65]